VARDLGLEFALTLYTDSQAARAMVRRKGVGKVRHLEVSELWVQDAVKAARFKVEKIEGELNPADILTKYVETEKIHRHMHTLSRCSLVFPWKLMFSLVFQCFSMTMYVFLWFSLVLPWKLMFPEVFRCFSMNMYVFRWFSWFFQWKYVLSFGFSMFFNEYVNVPCVFFCFLMEIYVFLWVFNVFQ
jgi:hypothetical protein